jgi:hypothetical protein
MNPELTPRELQALRGVSQGTVEHIFEGKTSKGLPLKIAVLRISPTRTALLAFYGTRIVGDRRIYKVVKDTYDLSIGLEGGSEFETAIKGKGIGSSLTAHAISHAEAQGAKKIVINAIINPGWREHLIREMGATQIEGVMDAGVYWQRQGDFGGRKYEKHLLKA